MRIRTNRIPFAEIVGSDTNELEFDPATDYLMVRSIFAKPTHEVRDYGKRFTAAGDDSLSDEWTALLLDLIGECIVEWHLAGPDGSAIPKPTTPEGLAALPGAVRTGLVLFLVNFRGKPDPTPAA